ncbi:cysteinyl-tRNA synthetase [Coemansia sp. RSA 552]|nr:cysteinyl-tRNA synthetase [Coemansia sp. RSA 552]
MSLSNNSSPWDQPESTHAQTGLKVYNTLTKSKVPFVPRDGNRVSWYGCGPTVYDAAHMGHARNYLVFDIIRRIMEDYLGYDLSVVMNITDIDDKIILRARQKYLLGQFLEKADALTEQTVDDVRAALFEFVNAVFGKTVDAKIGRAVASDQDWKAFAAAVGDGKDAEFVASDAKASMHFTAANMAFQGLLVAEQNLAAGQTAMPEAAALISSAGDVLEPWLDRQHGAGVTDQRIFRDLAAFWENDYFEDMDALNVRRPQVLTRVSEFVPEIVSFVQRIIDNGYAYEAEGSVYFDVAAFDGKDGHFYAKLNPQSKGDTELLADGEGSLSKHPAGKRSTSDFALWKSSKPGEPQWESPWSPGRPGWHIECSVMASEILGQHIDIHTGGIDLAFPHHDNELAQSEACFEHGQWVNYFLHAGHLNIEGQKMSKSLKNFITIKEALKKYSARQIRMFFLLSQWNAPLNFGARSMEEAVSVEKMLGNFFANVSALMRDSRLRKQQSGGERLTHEPELELLEALNDARAEVHRALLDSFDTPAALHAIQGIVSRTNAYLQRGRDSIDPQTIQTVVQYVSKIVRVLGLANEDPGQAVGWGLAGQGAGGDREAVLLPVATVLSDFRDAVRELALSGGDKKSLLELCDRIRDQDLPELGIVIDDHGDGRALVKIADPEELRRDRERRAAEEAERQRAKQLKAEEAERKRLERLEKGRVAPQDMFRTPEMCELYSAWDEQGIPTKDKAGEDLPKSKAKKLAKEHKAQEALHKKYLESQA